MQSSEMRKSAVKLLERKINLRGTFEREQNRMDEGMKKKRRKTRCAYYALTTEQNKWRSAMYNANTHISYPDHALATSLMISTKHANGTKTMHTQTHTHTTIFAK